MGKVTVKKLVSLILERIEQSSAPDRPLFFRDLASVQQYFGSESHEAEMGEMANVKKEFETLPEPINLGIEEIAPGTSGGLPKIISMDPATNELVENRVIGDQVMTMPNGVRVLKFYNFGIGDRLDRASKEANYIVLPENLYYKHPPRNIKMGTGYQPKDLTVAPEGENDDDKEDRMRKIAAENEGYAKKYVIFPTINNFFAAKKILDRLDVSLIPETWASPLRTERVTNKEIRMSFGGNSSKLSFDVYAVRDIDDIGLALDDILKTRMDIEDGVENRERNKSATKPREYANYIYRKGGNWRAIQRIFDENAFKEAGEYTKILKLLKKNIQEGKKGFNVFSKTSFDGDVSLPSDEYFLKARFTANLNYRTIDKEVEAGELIQPIDVQIRNPLPENLDKRPFSARNYPEFFRDMMREILVKLGQEMIAKINPDEVLNKISDIAIPTNLDKEFVDTDF